MWTWTIVPVYFCFILLLVISRLSWALDDMVRWFTFSLTIALISYISDFLSHHGRCHHSHHGSIQSFSFNQYHFLPIRSLLRSLIIVSGGLKWGLWGKGKGWQTVVIIHSTLTYRGESSHYNLSPFFLCSLCLLWSIVNSLWKLWEMGRKSTTRRRYTLYCSLSV